MSHVITIKLPQKKFSLHYSIALVLVFFTFDTLQLFMAVFVDDEGRKLATIDTCAVQTFGVLFEIETSLGVVAIENRESLGL